MPPLKYFYSKKRKNFGRQILFQDVPAVLLDSILPNKDHWKDYILRNPINMLVQATLPQSEHDANTNQVVMVEEGMNHTEGGWPRDLNVDNEEHVLRHCRRERHDENYIHTVMSLEAEMTHCIDQNNAIDLYQTYFEEMPPQPPVEKPKIIVSNEFKDTSQRAISCVVWTNEKKSKLAVSYFLPKDREINRKKMNTCYLWDITRHDEPMASFYPSDTCLKLACSPEEPEIIVAGLENGTVSLFDLRTSKHSVSNSSLHHSHRDQITGLLYINTRTNSEFFTGSADGRCLWWDTRKLYKPLEMIPMCINVLSHQQPDLATAHGISSTQYDKNVPTKLLCGTESGLVININRMGREHSEVISSYWQAHSGPVRTVERSPCTMRMFLTCGDFSVRIWSEEVRTAPIIVFKPYRHQVLDVAWAPLRYSSFMSVCAGGHFYYWDLLRRYDEPIASHKVTEHELTNVTPHWDGNYIAVADNNGSVFLLEVPEFMATPAEYDKHLVQQIYERETKREHILDNRLKEIKLKARQEEEAAALAEAGEDEPKNVEPDEEELVIKAEENYWKIIKEELSKINDSSKSSSINHMM